MLTRHKSIMIGQTGLRGYLTLPPDRTGIVIFAHTYGCTPESKITSQLTNYDAREAQHRRSGINRIAKGLHKKGLATLRLDLLTNTEAENRINIFDIPFLVSRLLAATETVYHHPDTQNLPIAYFGDGTGAAAAMAAETKSPRPIRAVICCNGRTDLALDILKKIRAPTLLLVNARDSGTAKLNDKAYSLLRTQKELTLITGTNHETLAKAEEEKAWPLKTPWPWRGRVREANANRSQTMSEDERKQAARLMEITEASCIWLSRYMNASLQPGISEKISQHKDKKPMPKDYKNQPSNRRSKTKANIKTAQPELSEAVGVFQNAEDMQKAVDELQENSFSWQQISVLASDKTIEDKLGHIYDRVEEAEDDPDAPRTVFIANEIMAEAEGIVIGLPLYLAAVTAGGIVAASGGTMLAAAFAAVGGGAGGAAIGTILARLINKRHADKISSQLERGGLLLWVNVASPEQEKKALSILKKYNAIDVHIHDIPIDEYGEARKPVKTKKRAGAHQNRDK